MIEGYTDLGPTYGREKQAGKYALVFMIRGKYKNWRCPITYTISHNNVPGLTLSKIILDMIDVVEKIGFIVKSMVCDLGSTNSAAIKELLLLQKNHTF